MTKLLAIWCSSKKGVPWNPWNPLWIRHCGWIGNGTDESKLFLFVDVGRVSNGADELELLLFSRVGIKSDESELLLVGTVSNRLTEAAHEKVFV